MIEVESLPRGRGNAQWWLAGESRDEVEALARNFKNHKYVTCANFGLDCDAWRTLVDCEGIGWLAMVGSDDSQKTGWACGASTPRLALDGAIRECKSSTAPNRQGRNISSCSVATVAMFDDKATFSYWGASAGNYFLYDRQFRQFDARAKIGKIDTCYVDASAREKQLELERAAGKYSRASETPQLCSSIFQ